MNESSRPPRRKRKAKPRPSRAMRRFSPVWLLVPLCIVFLAVVAAMGAWGWNQIQALAETEDAALEPAGVEDAPVRPEDVPPSDTRITVVSTDYAADSEFDRSLLIQEKQLPSGYQVRTPDHPYRYEEGQAEGPNGWIRWRLMRRSDDPSVGWRLPAYDVTINVLSWESEDGPTGDEIHQTERDELASQSEFSEVRVERGLFQGIPCLRSRGVGRTPAGVAYYVSSYHVFGDRHVAIGVVSDDGFDGEHHREGEAIAFTLTPLTPAGGEERSDGL